MADGCSLPVWGRDMSCMYVAASQERRFHVYRAMSGWDGGTQSGYWHARCGAPG